MHTYTHVCLLTSAVELVVLDEVVNGTLAMLLGNVELLHLILFYVIVPNLALVAEKNDRETVIKLTTLV